MACQYGNNYYLPRKFNIDLRYSEYAALVRCNQMTREEALEIISKPAYDSNKIEEEFSYIATKLGITNKELQGYFEMPKKYYSDYKNLNKIFIMGAKFVNLFGIENVKRRKK